MIPYYMQKVYKIMLRNGNLGTHLPAYDPRSPNFLRNLALALQRAEVELKAEKLRKEYENLPGLEGLDFIA